LKKISLLSLLVLVVFSACEKDDFCIQNPVTSKLIIDFYDDTNRETLKNVQRFSIIAQGETDSVFTNKTYNSISIPLNYLNAETSETVYTLKKNDSKSVCKALSKYSHSKSAGNCFSISNSVNFFMFCILN